MKMSRRTLLSSSVALTATAALPACVQPGTPAKGTDLPLSTESVTDILQGITDQMLTAYPESASSSGVDTGKYLALKSRLTDRSPAGQAGIKRDVRASLAKLKKIDTARLPADEALHVDVVRTVHEMTSDGFDFPYGDVALLNSNWSYRNSPYAVAQNTGAFVEIPTFLDSAHQIETAADADAYLSRMEAYADQLDGETDRTRAAGELGVVLPDFLMKKTLGQLQSALSTAPEDWGIVTSVASRSADLAGDYADKAKALAESKIGPALERQIAALETLAPNATSDAGVWALPQGGAYYDWALRAGTTTTLTPDEVHESGLEELASLQARMDPILRSIGYTEGSVGTRMTALAEDPRYKFSEGDKGREEILSFIDTRLEDIRARMPDAFETLVPGFLEVTRIPVEVEAGAPGAYGGAGSIDGKQPGHFWINLRTPDLQRRFTLPDLTYHEAIPGHVWQGEYTFKQPLVRSLLGFNAYSEGWAL